MNKGFSFSFLFLCLTFYAVAQIKPIVYSTEAGAIQGYDPVAYFKESKAVSGGADLTYKWNDAVCHFSSHEDLDLFKAEPEKYAPQYGGYCAFTVASGRKEVADPTLFNVVDGKLYLHYNPFVRKTWLKNPKGLIAQADKRWIEIVKK